MGDNGVGEEEWECDGMEEIIKELRKYEPRVT